MGRAQTDAVAAEQSAKVFLEQGNYAAAIGKSQLALEIQPDFAEAYEVLGDAYLAQRRVQLAAQCYTEALRLGADPMPRLSERWSGWMLMGCFEQAWKETDRIEQPRREGRSSRGNMLWDGTSFRNRDVVVRCWHGLGDTIQFLRYAPALREYCNGLKVEVQPRLFELVRDIPWIDEVVVPETIPMHSAGVEIECMELAYAFRTTVGTIPARVPYLELPPELIRSVRHLLPATKALKVGLVWASSTWHAARSLPFDLIEPLARIPGVQLYSLQRGPEAARLAAETECGITDLEQHFDSLLETAAVLMNLDLLITVDTMVAHLAGALARPVWLMLMHAADWRWMIARRDSPWYPTMRILRQPVPGDWASVVQQLETELASLAGVVAG